MVGGEPWLRGAWGSREEGPESPVQTPSWVVHPSLSWLELELMHCPAPDIQHTQISSPDKPGSLSLCPYMPLPPTSVFRKIYCLYGNYYGLMGQAGEWLFQA